MSHATIVGQQKIMGPARVIHFLISTFFRRCRLRGAARLKENIEKKPGDAVIVELLAMTVLAGVTRSQIFMFLANS